MPVHPLFRAASEMAERSLGFLDTAQLLIRKGNVEDARICLEGIAALASSELMGVLEAMREDLARVADGRIAGRGGRDSHRLSAHDAVLHLWVTIDLLLADGSINPPRTDLIEWLDIDTSALRVALVRERAKLSSQPPGVGEAKPPQPPTVWRHPGKRAYSRDGVNPEVVSLEEDNVLTVFAGDDTAFGTRGLADKSGVTNVSRVMGQLAKKLGAAVRVPGKGKVGGRGYYVRVRPATRV